MTTSPPWTYERLEQWAVWSAGRFPTTEKIMRLRLARQLVKKSGGLEGNEDPSSAPRVLSGKANCEYPRWVDRTIAVLKDRGLIDDRMAATAMVTAMRRKGMSKRAMLARLRQKGASVDACSAAFKADDFESTDSDAELEAALRYLKRRRLGPFRLITVGQPVEPAEFAKALRALTRAGFDYETAHRALECAPEPPADPE